MVQELCKDKGNGHTCYDDMLSIMKDCVDFEAASITDDSIPGSLTLDDIFDAAELLCHFNEGGQSCGVSLYGAQGPFIVDRVKGWHVPRLFKLWLVP